MTDDPRAWDAFVSTHSYGHVLQSWAWGELKRQFGWRVVRLQVPGAAAQVLFRALPGGFGSVGYVPRGPVLDPNDSTAARLLWPALRRAAQRERAIFLKLEPDWADVPEAAEVLRGAGLRPSSQSVQPRTTLVVDLESSPDELLARMKQKTRYNVRLAGRKGVIVRTGAERDIPLFHSLMQITASRDQFSIHSLAYYRAAFEPFAAAGHGCLLLAEHRDRLLGAIMVFAFADKAWYMYGASADRGRSLMPNYLLQWEGMRWARAQGARIYDLWGVPDEDEETLEAEFTQRGDGLWGVYRFKRGFGGHLVRTVGAWDWVYSPVRYRLYGYAVDLRSKLLPILRRGSKRHDAGGG